MNKNLKRIITDVIKNKGRKWDICYQARQIFIPKTDNRNLDTCRPITILPTMIKLMETSILNQINQEEEQGRIQKIDHRQTGFCTHRSTTFNLLRLQQRIKKLENQGKTPIVIFYDFKGAFDSPVHDKAWKALRQQGFSTSLLKQIFWLYGKVKINNQRIGRGFLQGGIASPRLYIQYQQQALQEVESIIYMKTGKQLDFLAFADDLAIIAEDSLEMEAIVKQFESTIAYYGLQVNQSKTEYMIMNETRKNMKLKKEYIERKLKRYKLNYKYCEKFKYLGIRIESNGNIKENYKHILKKFNKYKYLLGRVAFITKNTTMITNTWATFIRAQFSYGLTLIKENDRKTTWQQYLKLYYKSLVQTLGMFRSMKGEEIARRLMIPQIEEIEQQYKQHVLQQMKKLTRQQIESKSQKIKFKNINKEIKMKSSKQMMK
ncbi:ORF2 reverse transcriptase [Tetrahymena thermophila SB210]|uniref:ORF2 reverse transcriptase n=1 Tax=Tetrahymena thermophila (strain SB210) TaxID=312017 RepID=A0A1B9C278_TETTS|nr:ORF2 reverse transcriptase [Tetrahymena thermophila SB210]